MITPINSQYYTQNPHFKNKNNTKINAKTLKPQPQCAFGGRGLPLAAELIEALKLNKAIKEPGSLFLSYIRHYNIAPNMVHLPERLSFSPAKSLDEAAYFAKRVLKIKKFEFTDLELANYTNESLAAASNFHRGSLVMPRDCVSIKMPKLEKGFTAARAKGNHILEVNSDLREIYTKDINDFFHNFIKNEDCYCFDYVQHSRINELGAKFYSGSASFKELHELWYLKQNYAAMLNTFYTNPARVMSFYLKSPNCPSFLAPFKMLQGKEQIMSALAQLPRFNMILSEHNQKFKKTYDFSAFLHWTSDDNPISHEMGHFQHFISKEIGTSIFTPEEEKIAKMVSDYASTNVAEFVAETYAMLLTGKKPPQDVIKMYLKYSGPIPPHLISSLVKSS